MSYCVGWPKIIDSVTLISSSLPKSTPKRYSWLNNATSVASAGTRIVQVHSAVATAEQRGMIATASTVMLLCALASAVALSAAGSLSPLVSPYTALYQG